VDAPALRRVGARLPPSSEYAWSIPGLVAVGLMLLWAVHDGGYDADTWYWGALAMVALLAGIVIARGPSAIRIPRAGAVALVAFSLYVAWSYLSISWAGSPGDALTGSNRALLYLLVFATMLVLPWTVRGALVALVTFTLGVAVIAVVLLVRLASADHVDALVIDGRLAAPTGYFNSTAALFTIEALTATALAARRELPGLLRGALIASACAGLQLSVIVQSRGWLFTLPLVLVGAIVLLPDRLRVAAAATIPVATTLIPLHRLLDVYQATPGAALNHAANRAGHSALLLCFLAFVIATVLAWGESLMPAARPSALRRRMLGSVAVLLATGAAVAGGLAVSHGHPFQFASRQWHGFSHESRPSAGSHFTDVGSGRYDFWRVALDAFVAHPIGGLGQDNFDNYYVTRRRTDEEPSWTHSLELRLLAHTGLVGTALFGVFLIAGFGGALRGRRRRGLHGAVAATALLPLVVWLVYGSVDWFWEFPALSGPALGFLAIAIALGARSAGDDATAGSNAAISRSGQPARAVIFTAGVSGALALVAAVVVLGFPYLSVRETSIASDLRQNDPSKALHVLDVAADLNPLSADPSRLAGTVALTSDRYRTAQQRFEQVIARDPGGWYGWFGAGLAASALADRDQARHDFAVAAKINPGEDVIKRALGQVGTTHPLSAAAALRLLALSL
jgi:hypothetical protein